MLVAVRFEFKTEAEAVTVAEELEATGRAVAVEIHIPDGRTMGFAAYREELMAKLDVAPRELAPEPPSPKAPPV